MKMFLLTLFAIYLTVDFFATFKEWMRSKSNKEYWFGFVDTITCGGMILAFIDLVNLLVKEAV